jgi:hypothetical protein
LLNKGTGEIQPAVEIVVMGALPHQDSLLQPPSRLKRGRAAWRRTSSIRARTPDCQLCLQSRVSTISGAEQTLH